MTQFEAGVDALVKQVEQIYLEANGGGNGGESYAFAWWAAVNKTVCDAITKRGRRGYLFTIGDECCLPVIPRQHIIEFGGVGTETDVLASAILVEAQKFWNVFHLIVKPVPYQDVLRSWDELLGDRAISVQSADALPEVIVALIRLCEGQTNVTDDLDNKTAQIVKAATQRLLPASV